MSRCTSWVTSVNDNLNERMLNQARLALEAEPSDAEKQYDSLIDELERAFGKNHKEVAAELQRIAKSIEDGGEADAAFAFKQRTCEILLKRNMEQRRLNRPAQHPVPPEVMRPMAPPVVARLLGPLEYICMPTKAVLNDVQFYKEKLNAEQVFDHDSNGVRAAAVKFAPGPALLFIQGSELDVCQPAYTTDDATKILNELGKHGLTPTAGPIATGIGSLFSFSDASGNRFAVLEKRRGRQ